MKAIKSKISVLVAAGLLAGSGAVWAAATDTAEFTATATLTAAVTVDCGTGPELDFGTVSRTSAYAGGETIVIAAASGFAPTAGVGLATNGTAGVACTIANETGSNATAALSGASGAWASPSLEDAVLAGTGDAAGSELLADVTLSDVSGIGNSTTLYIGGTLTVKNSTDAPNGAYTSGTITLTVTE